MSEYLLACSRIAAKDKSPWTNSQARPGNDQGIQNSVPDLAIPAVLKLDLLVLHGLTCQSENDT